jgi:type IV pilus assembly protein PilN
MIRINLLPNKKSRARTSAVMPAVLLASVCGLALVAALGTAWYYDQQVKEGRKRIEAQTAQIAELKKIIGEVSELEKQTERLKSQLGVINKLEKGKRGPVRVLSELGGPNRPKRVWFTNFNETGGKLTITGTAVENSDVSDLLKVMQKSKYFSDVQVKFTQLVQRDDGNGVYNFEIGCTVNYSA